MAETQTEDQRRWTADTLLEKYFGVTGTSADDEAIRVAGRERLARATSGLVTSLEIAPEHGVRARLLVGYKGNSFPVFLDLTDNGRLDAYYSRRLNGLGRPEGGRLSYANMEAPVPRIQLNSFASMAIVSREGDRLGSAYKRVLHDVVEEGGRYANAKNSFDHVANFLGRKVAGPRIGTRIKEFRTLLDQDALKSMNKLGDHRPELYNVLMAFDAHQDPTCQRNRRQAVAAYPLVAPMLLADIDFRRAVDEARPLKEAIAKAVKAGIDVYNSDAEEVPTKVIGRLQGLTRQRVGNYAYQSPGDFICVLNDTPIDWLPTKRADWAALQATHQHARTNNLTPFVFKDCRTTADFMKLMGPDWQAAAKTCNSHAGLRGVTDLRNGLVKHAVEPTINREIKRLATAAGFDTSAKDWLSQYRDTGEMAAQSASSDLITQAKRQISKLYTLAKALETSDAWHDRLPATNAAIHKIKSGEDLLEVAWGKAFPDWTAPNGHALVMLKSEAELRHEGDVMNHCVGGYAADCCDKTIIFSVRNKQGKQISTLQLDQDIDSRGEIVFHQVQHYGPRDTTPSKGAVDAVTAWHKAYKAGQIPFDAEGLAEGREHSQKALKQNTAGDLELDDAQRQALWDVYRRFMPKGMREASGPGAWFESSGLKEKAAALFAEATESTLAQQEQIRRFDAQANAHLEAVANGTARRAANNDTPDLGDIDWDHVNAALERAQAQETRQAEMAATFAGHACPAVPAPTQEAEPERIQRAPGRAAAR